MTALERNAAATRYPEGTIGRLMEPPTAVFQPDATVDQTIEQLRSLVRSAFITYGYVTDSTGRLVGIVTMRDLLFAQGDARLESLMLRDPFHLTPDMPLASAWKLVLDRHYPVYPVATTAYWSAWCGARQCSRSRPSKSPRSLDRWSAWRRRSGSQPHGCKASRSVTHGCS
jgi:hypothetical protein